MSIQANLKFTLAAVLIMLFLGGCSSYKYLLPRGPELTPELPIKPGVDYFVTNAYQHTDRKTVKVWTYKPENWSQDDKVLFVMHGMSRNGKDYLDEWVEIAKAKNILVIVPEFHNKYYRYTTNDYQDGNLFDFFGNANPPEEWAFQVIDNIVEHINRTNPFDIAHYDMFGHSAGAQFVHRMVLLYPKAKLNTAIAANAGVYTFPHSEGSYPYALPAGHAPLDNAFKTNLIVLVGADDTSAQSGVLDQSTAARKQGQHRRDRGERFYSAGKGRAEELESQFNWKFQVVPKAGHNKRKMIRAAALLL